MRLIDADELKKKVYMEEDPYGYTKMVVLETDVDEAPTIDAVIVIRCKDCALWNDTDSEHLIGYCTEGDGEKITFRNEWCCWAERRDENADDSD